MQECLQEPEGDPDEVAATDEPGQLIIAYFYAEQKS